VGTEEDPKNFKSRRKKVVFNDMKQLSGEGPYSISSKTLFSAHPTDDLSRKKGPINKILLNSPTQWCSGYEY
jgi:hypothetical protein